MRALILALAVLPAAAGAEVVQPAKSPPCAVDDRVLAAVRAGEDGVRRLDRLPPAAEYLAVYRTVDRCPTPAVVRFDIGSPRR